MFLLSQSLCELTLEGVDIQESEGRVGGGIGWVRGKGLEAPVVTFLPLHLTTVTIRGGQARLQHPALTKNPKA